MNIIFFGTGVFAEIILKKIISEENLIKIKAVITMADKPAGRGLLIKESPVKILSQKHQLNILQPPKLKDLEFINELKKYSPYLIVIADYGKIIPQEILNTADFHAFNVHPSLLPLYRGPSPLESVILKGEKETGTSIILVDAEMDHGPIIYQEKVIINKNDNFFYLRKKLAKLSSKLLIKAIVDLSENKLKTKEQDHQKATFCQIIKKENGQINWNKSVVEIENQIKAYLEWPTSFTIWKDKDNKNKIIKIIKTKKINKIDKNKKPGDVFLNKKNLLVSCKDGDLILQIVIPEGKKMMTGYDFFLGHSHITNFLNY